jgi:DNA primase
MPGVDFDGIRSAVSMSQVLELIGFQPTSRRGPQLRGACPLHESSSRRSRSFSVNLASNRFYCFRCRMRGNQIELWAAVRKATVYAASVELCDRLRIEIPWLHRW